MKNAYTIEPRNPYFEIAASIIGHEINPKAKVTFFSEVDLTEIEEIRARYAAKGLAKPSYTAFVTKALALALSEYPYANRRVVKSFFSPFVGLRLQKFNAVDITVAIEREIPDAEMAAFVDVLRNVDTMTFDELGSSLRELGEATPANNKQWREFSNIVTRVPSWLAALLVRMPLYLPSMWVKYRGGAAMVSAPGKYGVDTVFANWWAPIGVSFGVVAMRPVVHAGSISARPTFNLTLNFDVRVMAGAQAAHFCRRVLDVLARAGSELEPWLSVKAAEAVS